MKFRLILALIFLLTLVLFTAQNSQLVKIQFMGWAVSTSKAVAIFSTFVAGILIGWFTAPGGKR